MTYVFFEIFRCDNAKIIEVIVENYDEELTVMEISEMSDVNPTVTKNCLDHLEKKHIVDKIRNNVYKFNKDNYLSKALVLFEHVIVSEGLKKAIKEDE